jgi:Ribonuclease G/E
VAMTDRGYIVEKCPHCAGTLRVRSLEQNALLHSLLGEIAAQKEWAGRKWDATTWKRLLTASFERTQGRSVEVVPAIDGHGLEVLYRRTSRMSKQELSELIEFVTAWAVQEGIKISDAQATA